MGVKRDSQSDSYFHQFWGPKLNRSSTKSVNQGFWVVSNVTFRGMGVTPCYVERRKP